MRLIVGIALSPLLGVGLLLYLYESQVTRTVRRHARNYYASITLYLRAKRNGESPEYVNRLREQALIHKALSGKKERRCAKKLRSFTCQSLKYLAILEPIALVIAAVV